MRIAVGSDQATHLTEFAIAELRQRGHELQLVGALASDDDARWPAVGRSVGNLVASNAYDEGLLFCYTGTGVSIAANKVPGIRAALTHDTYSAERAALSNNAQIITMGARVIEKHFTLDKDLPGTDHVLSVTPEELRELVTRIRRTEALLGDPVKQPQPEELEILEFVRGRFPKN